MQDLIMPSFEVYTSHAQDIHICERLHELFSDIFISYKYKNHCRISIFAKKNYYRKKLTITKFIKFKAMRDA